MCNKDTVKYCYQINCNHSCINRKNKVKFNANLTEASHWMLSILTEGETKTHNPIMLCTVNSYMMLQYDTTAIEITHFEQASKYIV